ncbi:uncharacterized F-box/LRR-repeat protein C02F5.7-like isoform X1 [Agrilus planipennis]|uniref:Uncharacterized F-box/LRR-repeat protein C02F5.7-like isoform X1 n=1 Tax=Agrilus planipennis TaxID=224129 RepID=A0A1W4WKV7_AGRPL|nr:uncharacterized F-box/LRR-repeat protein C02F5.7-like isoform X1 [Agrilus planipennis]
MPRHHQVASLQSLSVNAVGDFVVSLSSQILINVKNASDPLKSAHVLKSWIIKLQYYLADSIPYFLYNSVAFKVLQSVKDLIEKTKKTYDHHTPMSVFLMEMNVVVSLTETILTPNLKNIDFSVWPKMMRYVLYKHLAQLTGLEVLNLGSCTGGWRTADNDRCVIEGITNMKNLRSLCLCFDCSDTIVQNIGENCPQLQVLDITSSRSVTDRSIVSLLKCNQLRELQLHRTSVSVEGYAQLLTNLKRLQDLGRCDEFGAVIKYIHHNYQVTGPLGLRKIQTRDLSTENLRLLVDMCPNLEYISLFHDEQTSDLTILAMLDNLKELKLLSCAFYTDFLKQLLEIRGINLTSLHLEHVEEIDLDAIVSISQYCPLLKNLVLYNCDFIDQNSSYVDMFNVKPFRYLERIFWVVDCALTHLEFLLLNALNIKYIHLGSSTGITHASMAKILANNPMKRLEELRILYSSDMNICTVNMLLENCTNLRVLSELESWQGITMEELKEFRTYIKINNYDLDISPTLSYYTCYSQ